MDVLQTFSIRKYKVLQLRLTLKEHAGAEAPLLVRLLRSDAQAQDVVAAGRAGLRLYGAVGSACSAGRAEVCYGDEKHANNVVKAVSHVKGDGEEDAVCCTAALVPVKQRRSPLDDPADTLGASPKGQRFEGLVEYEDFSLLGDQAAPEAQRSGWSAKRSQCGFHVMTLVLGVQTSRG